jgi:hypothetical protein
MENQCKATECRVSHSRCEQRKNRMKSCLEGVAAKKKQSLPVEEKEKKLLREKN